MSSINNQELTIPQTLNQELPQTLLDDIGYFSELIASLPRQPLPHQIVSPSRQLESLWEISTYLAEDVSALVSGKKCRLWER